MPATRVLVIDDAPHLAQYLQHTLRKSGYDAHICIKPAHVQTALDDLAPAAVLINVEMQGGSGLELSHQLRSEKRNATLVIILVTGRIFGRGSKELTSSGADAILLKPVSPGAIIGKLLELGIAHDGVNPAARTSGSGTMVPLAQAEELPALERFKMELKVALSPLADSLRVGACLQTAGESVWLVSPEGSRWEDYYHQRNGDGGALPLRSRKESISLQGAEACTLTLVTDRADDSGLRAFASIVKQVQRVVEIAQQRDELFEELGLDHECLNSMYEISAEGQVLRDPNQAFDTIVKRTVRALSIGGPVRLILWLYDESSGMLEGVRQYHARKPEARGTATGLVGRCFTDEASVVFNFSQPHVAGSTEVPADLDEEFHGARHIALAPIKGVNRTLGVIAVWNEDAANLDSRQVRLLEAMAAQTATAIENERLVNKTIDSEIRERELAIGAKIQESLLFGAPPTDSPDFEFGLFAAPSLQIGGDFFEFFRYGSCCDIVLGDVMGKGVPAALVGAAVKGQFLRYAREQRGDGSGEAKNIVAAVHRDVSSRLINLECFITVCYARFDAATRQMTYVDCGHPRPLHFSAATGKLATLEFDWPRLVNIPLGTHPLARYEQASVEFHPGDVFLFYSDGFTEAVGENDTFFGEETLPNLLVKHSHRHATEIAARVQRSLQSFVKAGSVRDDLTCIVVKILDKDVRREGEEDVLEIDAVAEQLPRLRAFIQSRCEQIPYFKQEEQQLYNLQTVVTEAATNIVKYAYAGTEIGRIRIQLQADNHKVDIKLYDTGKPFDPATVPEPEVEGFQESGRGVYMIKAFMDQVSYLREARGTNCLHMVKIIERRRARNFE